MNISLTITTPEIERVVPVALLEGSFERKLADAARLGCDGVELMTARPETLDAGAIRAQLEQAGLRASAVSSGAQASLEQITLLATGERALQRLEALAAFAAAAGAPILTIGSFRGRVGQGEHPGAARTRLVEVLRRGTQIAGERGVRLVIEPLNRYETDLIYNVEDGLELIEAVGAQNLGLLFDTFHANIEEASLEASIRAAAAAGRLWHVHIADSNRLPPGQGHLDLPGVFRALEAVGYTGFCSAELLAKPDPLTAAQQTMDYWRGLGY